MPTTVSTSAGRDLDLWTAEEFLDWLEPGVHADLIDGRKFMHSPVNFAHARLLNFLDRLLAAYVEEKQLGELFREVVAVRLGSRNAVLPDLCFFTNEQMKQVKDAYAPFAPTWVCEALSPESADRDVGPKFAAFEEHGVQEYWVLDPDTLAHRFYARQGEILVEFAQGEEMIRSSALPGFRVRRTWLSPDSLPSVSACRAELLDN